MTMPDKIWYGKDPVYGTRDKVWRTSDLKRGKEPVGWEWQNITPYTRKDLADELARALEEAGDVIECYHKNTGIDLGAASQMPWYDDTMSKIDTILARYNAATEGK